MDYIDYIKSSFNLWKLDKKEAQKVSDNTYPILIGSILVAITMTIVLLFTFLPEIIVPSGDLIFEGINIAPFLLLLAPVFGVLSVVFMFLSFLWSYLWIKVFGGSRDLKKTIEVFLVIQVPFLLFNIIISVIDSIILILAGLFSEFIALFAFVTVMITFAFTVYYFVVVVNTISITHNMDVIKTVLAGAVSIVVAMAIIAMLLIIPLMILGVAFFM
ncbi:MAG: hypothetical protein LAT82_02530 [Nanoarchaeota archaeon]|nr:hypothetical protein [Nanoarchaeota archaeon]